MKKNIEIILLILNDKVKFIAQYDRYCAVIVPRVRIAGCRHVAFSLAC
jgi:hypothetical protein